MKYSYPAAYVLSLVALTFSSNSFSQTIVPTTTGLRCFYKLNASSARPETAFTEAKIWADNRAPEKYQVKGYWRIKDAAGSNMFYTKKTQNQLRTICQNTFKKEGINAPVEMFAAADSKLSINYTIWSLDPPETNQNGKINKIIAFGDSITDTQNLFNGTYWKMPNLKSFFLGRFSNGKVWLDYLSETFNLPSYNWSTGAAAAKDFKTFIPGIYTQVDSWTSYMDRNFAKNYQPENTLFTMLIGANDMKSHERNPGLIINEQKMALERLIADGGRNILLGNLPDISRSPAVKMMDVTTRDHIQQQIVEYNKQLATLVTELQEKYKDKKVNIQLFDIYGVFNDILNNKNGSMKNVEESCLDLPTDAVDNYLIPKNLRSNCTDPDSYVFWDLLHPTTRVHKVLADKAYCFIKSKYGSVLSPVSNVTIALPRCGG